MDAATRDYLSRRLTHLKGRLTLEVFTHPTCIFCGPMERALYELSNLTGGRLKIKKKVSDRAPGFRFKGLTFQGTLTNRQFNVFVGAMADLMAGRFAVAKPILDRFRSLRGGSINTFTYPSCPYSPPLVRTLYEIAWVNPKIKIRIVDMMLFAEEALKYRVHFSPTTVINDRINQIGPLNPEQLLYFLSL